MISEWQNYYSICFVYSFLCLSHIPTTLTYYYSNSHSLSVFCSFLSFAIFAYSGMNEMQATNCFVDFPLNIVYGFFIQNQRIFVHTAFHFISLDRFVELSTSFSFQPTFYYYFVPVFAICFLQQKFILLFKYLFVFSFIGVIFKSEYKKKTKI